MSDIQRDREERQHVIEVLKSWDGYFIGYTSDEVQEALRYAIASIETDLKYDLLYEETSGQADKQADKPITKNCESCRYYGSHHKVCNYCYKCSLWTEQEPTTKNDLAVDCIDRKKLIDWINIWDITPIIKNPLIRHIQGMSSATPQEPILDRVRAEIETKYGQCDICEYDAILGWEQVSDIADILQIIDKYKAESEQTDGNDD